MYRMMIKRYIVELRHPQVRLRVGNTDAEGRMAMVDVLCRYD